MILTSPCHVWFCGCWHCTVRGVAVVMAASIAVHGCYGCCCHGVWVLQLLLLQHVGVVAAIVVAHGCCGYCCCGMWVLQLLLSQHMGVAATIVVLCRVSWVLLLLCMVPVLTTCHCYHHCYALGWAQDSLI